MKPAFTIVIPTHNHADTLLFSVQSCLLQTRQDFEIFIVGDGVTDRTRTVVAQLMARDRRIHFFDNEKGLRHGEALRHRALEAAQGDYVCYLGDDDLWFPDHLETIAELLKDHDLVHVLQIDVDPSGTCLIHIFDAHYSPVQIELMRKNLRGFGLSTGAHTLSAYRRLPQGWSPAPTGIATDLHFWLQFLDQPWCRYSSHKWPTACHFSSVTRKTWTDIQRVEELVRWLPKIQNAADRLGVVKSILPHNLHEYGRLSALALEASMFDTLPTDLLSKPSPPREPTAPRDLDASSGESACHQKAKLAELMEDYSAIKVQLSALQGENCNLRNDILALRSSLSWKLTGPLRKIACWFA